MRMKLGKFEETYLRVDEDGDKVFNCMPCPFLGADNLCSIYALRPKACREFPDICQLVWLTKNTSYENVGGIFLRKNTIDS